MTALSHQALKCLDPRDLTYTLEIWHLKFKKEKRRLLTGQIFVAGDECYLAGSY